MRTPILVLHICAGMLAMLSGAVAASFRKGSHRHVVAGKVFVFSMLTMAAGGIYLAILKHEPDNVGGGAYYVLFDSNGVAHRPTYGWTDEQTRLDCGSDSFDDG